MHLAFFCLLCATVHLSIQQQSTVRRQIPLFAVKIFSAPINGSSLNFESPLLSPSLYGVPASAQSFLARFLSLTPSVIDFSLTTDDDEIKSESTTIISSTSTTSSTTTTATTTAAPAAIVTIIPTTTTTTTTISSTEATATTTTTTTVTTAATTEVTVTTSTNSTITASLPQTDLTSLATVESVGCSPACLEDAVCISNECVCLSGSSYNSVTGCAVPPSPTTIMPIHATVILPAGLISAVMPQALPGMVCQPYTECTGGSVCWAGICTCPPELVQEGTVCVMRTITFSPPALSTFITSTPVSTDLNVIQASDSSQHQEEKQLLLQQIVNHTSTDVTYYPTSSPSLTYQPSLTVINQPTDTTNSTAKLTSAPYQYPGGLSVNHLPVVEKVKGAKLISAYPYVQYVLQPHPPLINLSVQPPVSSYFPYYRSPYINTIPLAVGEHCNHGSTCVPGASCLNGVCVCAPIYVPVSGVCIRS
uniref:CC domain-containing protein n=1 Tax=Syphacia muris TaxID=451379 RepID=A0A0N5AYJ4_9BILA